MSDNWPEGDGELLTERKTRTRAQKPRRYKVLLHNDHYTTMEFVVMVLVSVFHKSFFEATRIMLRVHRRGVGVAGVYPKEIAETKVEQVQKMAREAQYPLQCTMEPE
ncbi:MAG: ATP-dependent Clp protease adapter ClpS [Deltaproteobacteria bacterium]|nr:MAG: ATP-dependent Clp protease adapter ClpS [Deltaproteobacteria bacterium]